jgi:hypothetical protein
MHCCCACCTSLAATRDVHHKTGSSRHTSTLSYLGTARQTLATGASLTQGQQQNRLLLTCRVGSSPCTCACLPAGEASPMLCGCLCKATLLMLQLLQLLLIPHPTRLLAVQHALGAGSWRNIHDPALLCSTNCLAIRIAAAQGSCWAHRPP